MVFTHGLALFCSGSFDVMCATKVKLSAKAKTAKEAGAPIEAFCDVIRGGHSLVRQCLCSSDANVERFISSRGDTCQLLLNQLIRGGGQGSI